MVDRLGSNTEYTIHKNALDPKKVVIGQKDGNIDGLELAEKLMEVEKSLAKNDEEKISKDSQKLTALQTLETLVTNFQRLNNPLSNYEGQDLSEQNLFQDERASFTPINGESTDNYISAATKPGINSIGQEYSIQVLQTAKKDILRSSTAIESPSTALGIGGNLVINSIAISIAPTDNLFDITLKIQKIQGTANVNASTALASPTSAIFWLKGNNLATPIDLSGTDKAVLAALNIPDSTADSSQLPTRLQALQSEISVDGYSFYRNTNTIDDIINGITLTTKAVMPSLSTLSFRLNTDALTTATKQWIDGFNAIKSFLKPHTIKPNDEDKDGKQSLFKEEIVAKTLHMLNQAKLSVDGLFGPQANISSAAIDFINPADIASELKYDPIDLAKCIENNTTDFLKLMGDYHTSSNSNVSITKFPNILPSKFANQPLTLTIANVRTNPGGATIFDATLTDGHGYSETLIGTTTEMTFQDPQKFGGFVLNYKGMVPLNGDLATITATQGVASKLRSKLAEYLKNPVDVSYTESLTFFSKEDEKNRGILGQEIYKIIKNKNSLKKKVSEANARAQTVYKKSSQKLQRYGTEVRHRKSISDLINTLNKIKR